MLILSRRKDEAIVIGGNIRIVVTEINLMKRRVSLGIEAPDDVIIDREEISTKREAARVAKTSTR